MYFMFLVLGFGILFFVISHNELEKTKEEAARFELERKEHYEKMALAEQRAIRASFPEYGHMAPEDRILSDASSRVNTLLNQEYGPHSWKWETYALKKAFGPGVHVAGIMVTTSAGSEHRGVRIQNGIVREIVPVTGVINEASNAPAEAPAPKPDTDNGQKPSKDEDPLPEDTEEYEDDDSPVYEWYMENKSDIFKELAKEGKVLVPEEKLPKETSIIPLLVSFLSTEGLEPFYVAGKGVELRVDI